MLREGHFSVEVEVEATSSSAATEGPAAAPPARRSGVRVVVAVVGGGHYVAIAGVMLIRYEFVSSSDRGAMWFVMVVVAASVYRLFVAVCGSVGVVHRSRGG